MNHSAMLHIFDALFFVAHDFISIYSTLSIAEQITLNLSFRMISNVYRKKMIKFCKLLLLKKILAFIFQIYPLVLGVCHFVFL